jgi:membrane associated rhomboid family serine protease
VFKYGAIPLTLTHPGIHCREILVPQATQFGVVQQVGEQCARGIPAQIPTWSTMFTAMFMHASILHLGGNMLFLWIFGNNVEEAMGPAKYLAFYIVGGLAALWLQVAVSPHSAAPTLGASGAIAAVLGGYIVLYPRARVITVVFIIFFFTVLELPTWVMLGIWFVQQAIFGAAGLTTPTGGGGVAYFAHVGGFAFGLLFVRLLATKRKAVPPPYPVY